MLCAFCNKEKANCGWDETSHLGKRPICYSCIGKRDVARMNRAGTIVLYRSDNKVRNLVGTLSFRIIEEKKTGNKTQLFFLFDKKRWEGVMYSEHSNMVSCRKYKKSS